jgi:hypothetical protein
VLLDPALALESALWDAVKDSALPIEVRAYLNRYPTGRFVAQAQARLTQLQTAATAATSSAVPLATDPAKTEAARRASAELAKAEALQVEQRARAQAQAVVAAEVARAKAAEQAAAQRRADALQAGLAKPAAPPTSPTPAPERPGRPVAASNSLGFTVGDRWRYQVVDKYKKEVVSNWSRKIDAVNSDGSLKLNGGTVEWTSNGSVKTVRGDDGFLREFSPAQISLPSTLKAGFSEASRYTVAFRNADGVTGTEEREGTFTVLAKEMVKVPAGEFEAWKFEASGITTGKSTASSTGYYSRFKVTTWYVPALRNMVASEFEVRNRNGQLQTFERNELTSFSVRGAELLAQR